MTTNDDQPGTVDGNITSETDSEDGRKTRWGHDGSTTGDRRTYAIVGVGTRRVKIGSANDILARGADHQISSPVELVLVASCDFNIERRMHFELEAEWIHGEWFKLSQPTVDAIRRRMRPAWHSFVSGLPIYRGRRNSRLASLATTAVSTRDTAHCAVGIDAFGQFGGDLLVRHSPATMRKLRDAWIELRRSP